MKKFLYSAIIMLVALTSMSSCKEEETYAEQKEFETGCINNFVNGTTILSRTLFPEGIQVISEMQFMQQNYCTYAPPVVPMTQFVLFEGTGVYMHIANKGCGEPMKNGENANIICRFSEYNINEDRLQLSNADNVGSATTADVMAVTNTSGSYTASFTKGQMYQHYESALVPNGWLVPLRYINLGRPTNENEQIAHVKIIVPHSQGQAYATSQVYACYYDITYQKGY